MPKVRINDLARELEVKSRAILDCLPKVGVTEKKTHSSSVEFEEAERVCAYFGVDPKRKDIAERLARLRHFSGSFVSTTHEAINLLSPKPSETNPLLKVGHEIPLARSAAVNRPVSSKPAAVRPAIGEMRVHSTKAQEFDFAAALESFEAESVAEAADPAEDKLIRGTVLKLTDKYIVVDVGFQPKGMVPLAQVTDRNGECRFKPGDPIDVVVDRGEGQDGYVLLSHEKAERVRVWDDLEKIYKDKSSIKGHVVDRVKGGLSVDVGGVRAFLPGSQTGLEPDRKLEELKGQELDVRVIKLNKRRKNIVVSRKQLLEDEQAEKRLRQVTSPSLPKKPERAEPTADRKAFMDWTAALEQLRVLIMELLDEIEPRPAGMNMEPGLRLGELTRAKKIPSTIEPWLKALIKIRNRNHYDRHMPTPSEGATITAVIPVIAEWGEKLHLRTASELRSWTPPSR